MDAAPAPELSGMSQQQLLAFAEERDAAERRAGCDKILTAYQWAVTNNGDRLDQAEARRPGRQRVVVLGADGTPPVAEFAAATLAPQFRISHWSAARLMADAIDLHHRLPLTNAQVVAGTADPGYARRVAQATRNLSPEEAAYVDEQVADLVDGTIPWTRFTNVVAGHVVQASPELAKRKEQAARQPYVGRVRSQEGHGMATLLVRGDTAVITQIETNLDALAKTMEPEEETEGAHHLRLKALLALTSPGKTEEEKTRLADLMPPVRLYVHTYASAGAPVPDVARVEGHGPVTTDWVRHVLGPHARFSIVPVLDIEGQAPIDAYEIPARHREAVHLMTPADVFPYAGCLTRSKQIDHTEPWKPPPDADDQESTSGDPPGGPPPDESGRVGQSRIGNYGPMTAHHHRVKTHGDWQVKQPFPGIYLWRDPHGVHYLVDHTGTRRLPPPPAQPAEAPRAPERSPLEAHYRDVILEYDAA